MNPNNIPPHIQNIMRRNDLSMNQKMLVFYMFMPTLPDVDLSEYNKNIEFGNELKKLLNDKKLNISLNKDFEVSIH